jgi:hypothetical protein
MLGHLTRAAIGKLRGNWQPDVPLSSKLARVTGAMGLIPDVTAEASSLARAVRSKKATRQLSLLLDSPGAAAV